MKKILITIFTLLLISSCSQNNTTDIKNNDLNSGDIVAVLETNHGDISIKMFTEDLPITTLNFLGLAQDNYYDGIIFHRVIKNFMIQGGDPEGTGRGGKSIYGDKFDDEFSEKYSNVRGTISMANAGPDTNGSQFFINLVDNVNLDFNKQPISSKHSVFGEVINGMDVVDKISELETNTSDKPLEDVVIKDIKLYIQKDNNLKNYSFDLEEKKAELQENIKKSEEEKIKQAEEKREKNKNRLVKAGDIIAVKYTGTLDDGTVFDSNMENVTSLEFNVGSGQMIPGFDNGVIGMKLDQEKDIKIEAINAYGPEKIEIDRVQLKTWEDDGLKLEVGTKIPTASGDLEIFELSDTKVLVTNPHPLAGKNLNFKIKLVEFKN